MRAFAQAPNLPQRQSFFATSIGTLAPAAPIPAEEVALGVKAPSRAPFNFGKIAINRRAPITVPARLTIASPESGSEQEADRVSEQVMRLPEPSHREDENVPAKRVGSGDSGQWTAPPIVHEVLSSPGRPLGVAERAFLEPRLGQDFSNVRVHMDAKAEDSARAVNARAYSVGAHVVFGARQYAPGTAAGRRLLAHELAHVAQQSAGPIALQRQPAGDRNDLARDLRELSDDLEKVRQQLAQGAEDLEILRLRFALSGQSLPSARSRADKKTTAFFVEALIETSDFLAPHLRGRLARTSVANNFTIYAFRSQFESKQTELGGGGGGPSIGQAAPQTQINGFFHRRTDSIHLPPDANFGDALHEGVHKYSSPGIQNAFGIYLNEGVTQYFADRVQAEQGVEGSTNHAYGDQLACAKTVLKWLGNDENVLAQAYFQGRINPLAQEILRRLGINLRDLDRLKREGEGSGLCERIKKAGP